MEGPQHADDRDRDIISRRRGILAAMRRIVGKRGVIADESELRVYECDGLTAYRELPLIVVLPETTDQIAEVLRYCRDAGVNVVPRGAGTSLSGGAMPRRDAVTLGLTRLDRILDIDLDNQCVTVQPGVTNLAISEAVRGDGFYYAPDPSSQIACTIGGNVAENSGGVHCLKYGLTTHNLLGVELVTIDGEVVRLGGKHLDAGGLDLMSVVCGSEGLLGIVTEVTVRILPVPECARTLLIGFPTIAAAGDCVARVIAAGIIPAGMEMMDALAIQAAEAYARAGYPLDVAALLLIELDGPDSEVTVLVERVKDIARGLGAATLRISRDDTERRLFWAGRKGAFPALGRLTPDYYVMDGTIPRRRLQEVLASVGKLSEDSGLRIANVFHAGDGNLHPLVLFDANRPGELETAERVGADILRKCVAVGGVLTGEHGVGIEKRDLMAEVFSEADLAHQERVKCAFDPEHRLNPGKMFPTLHRCAELGRLHVQDGRLPFPDIPRF